MVKNKEKKAPEKSEEKQPASKFLSSQTAFIGAFVLASIAVIVLIVILWKSFFSYRSLASYLPETKTIGFFEVHNIDEFAESLFPSYNYQEWIENYAQVNFENDVQPWLGKGFGLALIDQGSIEHLITIETTDQAAVKSFFGTVAANTGTDFIEDTLGDYPFYAFSSGIPYRCTLISYKLLCSQNQTVLEQVIAAADGSSANLKADSNYQRVRDNLPYKSYLFSYVDLKKLHNATTDTLMSIFQGYSPLLKLFQHGGMTLKHQNGDIAFHTVTYGDKSELTSKKIFASSKKFRQQFPQYFPEKDLIAYLGGVDFEEQFNATLNMLSELNPAFALIAEGIVNAQMKKYFGDGVQLREHVLPLLSEEYGLFISKSAEAPLTVSILLGHKDVASSSQRLEAVLKGFQTFAATLLPEIKAIELPDGTTVEELIADSSKVRDIDEEYNGLAVKGTAIKGLPYGFLYAVDKKLIIISSDFQMLKDIVTAKKDRKNTLSKSKSYKATKKGIFLDGDEASYINIRALLEQFALPEDTANMLQQFAGVMWKKKGFDDGVSVQGVITRARD